MDHIDVFSGIGGFAYAAKIVWGKDYHNVLFCDNNRFCQEVIKKNFGKDSLIYGDIREITKNRVIADTTDARPEEMRQEWKDEVFLLTGGFPCQPFSCAGKRKGKDDNRYLWPEMLRVISDFKPTWIIAENVRGLLTINQGLVFEQVCADLEGENYDVQPFIIPACAVNAPHRRDRVWIVAHRTSGRPRGSEPERDRQWQSEVSVRNGDSDVADTSSDRRTGEGSGIEIEKGLQQEPRDAGKLAGGFERPYCDAQNTISERSGGGMEYSGQVLGSESPEAENAGPGWEANWLEVATELCGVDDGLPVELDGFKLSKSGHRVERLKALGNAIVPQVAIEIMRAIKITPTGVI